VEDGRPGRLLIAPARQPKENAMEFTAVQQDLLIAAWVTARDDNGIVIENHAYPDAHDLAEMGWLERRFLPDGELAWFWTQQAETALDTGALINSAMEGRQN
jgi:hypothetical protein